MLWLKVDIGVEVVAEMLEKGDFLLELSFRWEITDLVRDDCVFVVLLFNVFEVLAVLVRDYFGRIVEVNTSRAIREQITKAIFRGIIDPLLHVDF